MPYYLSPVHQGLAFAGSEGDGYGIKLRWNRAFPTTNANKIAYHIYYSQIEDRVFHEGPKFISIDGYTRTEILDLTPGQLYHFAVRAVEYDPTLVDLTQLPSAFNQLKVYPESVLVQDISATDTSIPLLSTELFNSMGIIKIGVELINYLSNDTINNILVAAGGTPAASSYIKKQADGNFYLSNLANVGDGVIQNLTLQLLTSPLNNWRILCTEGSTTPGQSTFIAASDIFNASIGVIYNPDGSPITWKSDGIVKSNGVLSFSILDGGTTFRTGDYFTVNIIGPSVAIDPVGRGFDGTIARPHDVNGFDGYHHWSPIITFWAGEEELNSIIYPCQNRFDVYHDHLTIAGGYHQVTKDVLTTDLSASDQYNVGFQPYDYAGYHRTDPVLLLSGQCVGSYIGGQQGCADGESGVGMMIRGLSFQERNNQNQEVLLSLTGEPVCLVRRQWTGITCQCYLPSSEYPDDRCPDCYGTKFVVGWEQYFNPRRSDGRIMVRFSPSDDDLKSYEGGLESELTSDVWTLTVPTIKDRDFIVRFDQNGNEEFRYEVLSVNRNRTLTQLEGAQKFRVQRVRKFDPIYTVPVTYNTQFIPKTISTTVSAAIGIPPHSHSIVVSENITDISQIFQTTGVTFGHNHGTNAGVVTETLSHTHQIILP